jgi:hypothetical protein
VIGRRQLRTRKTMTLSRLILTPLNLRKHLAYAVSNPRCGATAPLSPRSAGAPWAPARACGSFASSNLIPPRVIAEQWGS